MIESNQHTGQETVQIARLQAWAMSLICSLLALFAIAAATRIPLYLETSDHLRLIGVILFGLLALIGVIDNLRTHHCLWRLRNETRA